VRAVLDTDSLVDSVGGVIEARVEVGRYRTLSLAT
jgi:hypothetical protein